MRRCGPVERSASINMSRRSSASTFGYGRPLRQHSVSTREGQEDGGWFLQAANGERLRAWSIASDIDLDGPDRSARAFRSSPTRIAQRVLLASGERAGLLTNGEVVRLLLCDPSRSDSHLSVGIDGWRQERSSGFVSYPEGTGRGRRVDPAL